MHEDKTGAIKNQPASIKAYRKYKLKMLSRDFRITITKEELAHAETLTTETQIDQFCLGMINKYWG